MATTTLAMIEGTEVLLTPQALKTMRACRTFMPGLTANLACFVVFIQSYSPTLQQLRKALPHPATRLVDGALVDAT